MKRVQLEQASIGIVELVVAPGESVPNGNLFTDQGRWRLGEHLLFSLISELVPN